MGFVLGLSSSLGGCGATLPAFDFSARRVGAGEGDCRERQGVHVSSSSSTTSTALWSISRTRSPTSGIAFDIAWSSLALEAACEVSVDQFTKPGAAEAQVVACVHDLDGEIAQALHGQSRGRIGRARAFKRTCPPQLSGRGWGARLRGRGWPKLFWRER